MLNFTDRTKKIMSIANQCAIEWNHEYIGTEHILMGFIKEGSGIGYAVLSNLDTNITRMQEDITNLVKMGPYIVATGQLSQTPRAKRVIEFAIKVAEQMNHSYVGTEHILLGLIENDDDMAAQILLSTGLTKEKIKAEILLLLNIKPDETKIDDIKTCTNCIHSDFCHLVSRILSQHMGVIKMRVGTNESLQLVKEIKQSFGEKCKNYEKKLQ